MPYYFWQGITLKGSYVKGTSVALNDADLQLNLMNQEIAVIRFYPKNWFFRKKLGIHDLNYVTHSCSRLISSGMPIVQALTLISTGFTCNQKKH